MITHEDYSIELIYDQTGTTQRPGGQHAGSPPISVRVTHKPTGLMAQCGGKSQHKAKAVAMNMLQIGLMVLEFAQ